MAWKSRVSANDLHLNVWTFTLNIYIVALYSLFIHLCEVRESKFVKYTYTVSCKCFGACKCKCIYYMSLMIIPSCKSISISCECIHILTFFLQWTILIGPSHKKSWYFDTLQTLAFVNQYGTMVMLFQEISQMHILPHVIAWVQLLLLLLFLWVVFNNKFFIEYYVL
jgi:hypothetical protein